MLAGGTFAKAVDDTHCTAIMRGLLRAFSRLVLEDGLSFIFFPLREPNFSRSSRPRRMLSMRSS